MAEILDNGTASTDASPTPSAPAAPPSARASLEKVSADPSPAASPAAPGTPAPPAVSAPDGSTAAATSQPGPVDAPKTGELPEHRAQAIARNVRAEVERQYAWVKEVVPQGFQPSDVQAAVKLIQRLRSDPRAFAADLSRELGGTAPTDDAEPQPDLVSEDGKYKTYSDAMVQQLLARREAKLLAQIKQDLAPVLGFVQTEREARATAAAQAQATSQATETLTAARALPHFTEHEAAIRDRMQQMLTDDPAIVDRIGAVAALYQAYTAVLKETVFPSLGRSSETKVLTDLKKKATAASGAVHPTNQAGSAPAPKLKPGDVQGLAAHLRRLDESMAS